MYYIIMEKTIQTKKCKHCSVSFDITDKDLEFYDKVSPIFAWKKYSIPTPTLCPDCRLQRRLLRRNRRNIYKRKSDASWKDIISMYSPDKELKIFHIDEWYSQEYHNPMNYWSDMNFSKSFLNQLFSLVKKVPLPNASVNIDCQNSEFCNWSWSTKDSYMCFNTLGIEKCLYSEAINYSEKCVDSLVIDNCNNIYSCVDTNWCSKSIYLINCFNCRDSFFLKNCIWCSNCFMCINLVNEEYCIYNKKYSKEEYNKKVNELKLWNYNSYNKYIEDFHAFCSNKPHKFTNTQNSEKSTWDYIFNTKNCNTCFDSNDTRDCKYISYVTKNTQDCYDISHFWANMSLCYEVSSSWLNCHNIIFSDNCFNNVSNLLYCQQCILNVNNCFWCVWLTNKSYCILNKQYTKQEYEDLVPKIIEKMIVDWEWWEFFPASMSPFWYNETVANEYYPLEKNDAIKAWFNWSDYEPPKPNVEKIIPASKLPENIEDIPDDILNWAIECEVTKKPFRIIKQELEFYRKHNLPIPRRHPDQRHLDRMALRNPRKLYDRKCDKCSKDIKTTYAPDRSEIVYCEKCYNSEMY